jgi:hypothetical protein
MKRCQPVTLHVRDNEDYIDVYALPVGGDDSVGFLSLEVRELEGILKVADANVQMPGCGLGTKLYERGLQIACDRGLRLASSTSRTVASEGFWKKQVRKKRARCVLPQPTRQWRHIPGAGYEETTRMWPCGRYAMLQACPRGMSLKGRRR